MNSGTSSPLPSSSLASDPGDCWRATIATAKAPSRTTAGCRPAQSNQPESFRSSVIVLPTICVCIVSSMPPLLVSALLDTKMRRTDVPFLDRLASRCGPGKSSCRGVTQHGIRGSCSLNGHDLRRPQGGGQIGQGSGSDEPVRNDVAVLNVLHGDGVGKNDVGGHQRFGAGEGK